MFATADMSRSKLDATIVPAQTATVTSAGVIYATDPDASLLRLQAGTDSLQVRLTWEQLNALHATLDALLADHTRYTLGHNEPAEVLADRDPTAPVIDPPSHRALNVRTINGNDVSFTATDDWRLCVHTVNGEPMSNRDLPDWDSYGEAVAYLETILETRPATKPAEHVLGVWTINGHLVSLEEVGVRRVGVWAIDGMPKRDLRSFPTWDTIGNACTWLTDNLETRPTTARS